METNQINLSEGNMSKVARFLLEHNDRQSLAYVQGELSRQRYRAKHPTAMFALKCMDGRINLPVIADIPQGIIQPFRNLGGQFNLGWPYFGSLLENHVTAAVNQGRRCIIFSTYHWSRGHREHGCKGFQFDVENAKKVTGQMVKDLETIFGSRSTVYPIHLGIETDEDALVFHGQSGEILDFGLIKDDESSVRNSLARMYPDMPTQMLNDLMPIVNGNIRHIAKVRAEGKPPTALDHGEDTLCFGRGYGWLHLPNKAVIIGPYSLDLETPITTGANILLNNLKSGRIPTSDGVVLMVSSVFRSETGADKPRAIYKSRELSAFAMKVIGQNVPELLPHMTQLVGIINPADQKFIQI